MRGTWQTESGGSVRGVALLAAAAALLGGTGAAIVAFLAELLLIVGALVGLALTAVASVVVLAWRRGWRPSLNPVVSWQPQQALPPPAARPVTARPAQALPAPQIVNFNFYGVSAAEAARVAEQQRRAIDEGR